MSAVCNSRDRALGLSILGEENTPIRVVNIALFLDIFRISLVSEDLCGQNKKVFNQKSELKRFASNSPKTKRSDLLSFYSSIFYSKYHLSILIFSKEQLEEHQS